tara:strand:+ start:89 stop:280 length:192 start_codon:yes stop_codon:yes gene_type:complete
MSKLTNIKMMPCNVCEEDMPELRTTLYGYKSCVNCSDAKPKRAVDVQFGEGDHTFNETIIIDD